MIDLHTHSTASDGKHSPEELVDMAKEKGLSCIAVSDHDTVEGSIRAVRRGKEIGMNVISAVEISASFESYILHILGYHIDTDNQTLIKTLESVREYRRQRAEAIVTNINEELKKEGKKLLELESVLALGAEKPLTRPDIAEYLVVQGYVENRQEAFERWLIKYNVPNKDLSTADAIRVIHEAGGVAVLAHPLSKTLSFRAITEDINEQDGLLQKLKNEGLDGVEVYRFRHTPEEQQRFLELAQRLDLIPAGGTDYHAPGYPEGAPSLGTVPVPDEVVELLEARRR